MGGTAARYDDATQDLRSALTLQNCVKSRAENLMIADLLRNDLSRSCELGSVNVTELCALESFATVHQLVTTVEGTASTSTVDVVKQAFPPGSMTGAPKRRTCEILDDLDDVAVLCSSPERFLSIDATTKRVEARPFKGTAARFDDATQDLRSALTLQNCIKSNAENL